MAIVVLVVLLWRPLAGPSRTLRLGLLVLGLAGALGVLDGAVPLSCARSLDPSCTLDHDAIDVVHTVESIAVVLVTLVAFWLVGIGLRREGVGDGGSAATPGSGGFAPTRPGDLTLVFGALWLLLSALLAAKYAIHDLASIKGLVQRGGQVVLGAWLVALGAYDRAATSAIRLRLFSRAYPK